MGVRAKTTGNHQALSRHGCKQEHAGCPASGQACLGIERVFEQARRSNFNTVGRLLCGSCLIDCIDTVRRYGDGVSHRQTDKLGTQSPPFSNRHTPKPLLTHPTAPAHVLLSQQ